MTPLVLKAQIVVHTIFYLLYRITKGTFSCIAQAKPYHNWWFMEDGVLGHLKFEGFQEPVGQRLLDDNVASISNLCL